MSSLARWVLCRISISRIVVCSLHYFCSSALLSSCSRSGSAEFAYMPMINLTTVTTFLLRPCFRALCSCRFRPPARPVTRTECQRRTRRGSRSSASATCETAPKSCPVRGTDVVRTRIRTAAHRWRHAKARGGSRAPGRQRKVAGASARRRAGPLLTCSSKRRRELARSERVGAGIATNRSAELSSGLCRGAQRRQRWV